MATGGPRSLQARPAEGVDMSLPQGLNPSRPAATLYKRVNETSDTGLLTADRHIEASRYFTTPSQESSLWTLPVSLFPEIKSSKQTIHHPTQPAACCLGNCILSLTLDCLLSQIANYKIKITKLIRFSFPSSRNFIENELSTWGMYNGSVSTVLQ